MRRLRARRGDIGGPIVTLLLAVAGIAIAVIVIGYMMGAVGGMKKPIIESDSAFVYKNGTSWTLEFNLENPSGKTINITDVRIKDDTGNLVSASSITPKQVEGHTKAKIKATFNNANLGSKDQYTFIVDTTAGTVQAYATIP